MYVVWHGSKNRGYGGCPYFALLHCFASPQPVPVFFFFIQFCTACKDTIIAELRSTKMYPTQEQNKLKRV